MNSTSSPIPTKSTESTKPMLTSKRLNLSQLLVISCWLPVVGVITGGVWLFKQETPNPDPGPIGIHSIVHGLYGGLILWWITQTHL